MVLTERQELCVAFNGMLCLPRVGRAPFSGARASPAAPYEQPRTCKSS